MFLMRFTERAYTAYTEEAVRNSPNEAVRLTFSNSNFDPTVGARQYNEYLDEYEYCEEAGFDGLMLNEHHNTPTCLGATMNLEAAILARNTKKPKIVLMGNPLPTFENPLRVAEEIAEIDMISNGRVVSGFVRGTGVESLAANINPLHNRERFEEAHDLIIKTWTTPGPFRWEGKHYQFRVVNPWMMPMQKPHPPIWVGGEGRRAIRRAARFGDGWQPLGNNSTFPMGTAEELAVGLTRLDAELERAGRPAGALEITSRMLGYDLKKNGEASGSGHAAFAGTADEIASEVRRFQDLGVSNLVPSFHGVALMAESREAMLNDMEDLANEVMPKV